MNTQDGYLVPEAFHLDGGRDDGYAEISITWNDEADSFDTIASQLNERTGQIQFSAGISEIRRSEFELRMKPQIMNQNVGYERRPTSSNRYHGNILVKESLDRTLRI